MTTPASGIHPGLPRRDQREAGRALRERCPRESHADWRPAPNRDPLALIRQMNAGRIEELLPERQRRMSVSPFAFFRGSAAVMTADLAGTPVSGLNIPVCGDCHLENFGWFASPERDLVFDITDFDETTVGPWEWDLKRLIVSAVLAARIIGADRFAQAELALRIVRTYRRRVAGYAEHSTLGVWYERLNRRTLLVAARQPSQRRALRDIMNSARSRTVFDLLRRHELTERVRDHWVLKDEDNLHHRSDGVWSWLNHNAPQLLTRYAATLQPDRRELLSRFQLVDLAWKIAGIGSVGLRCGLLLLQDAGEGLLLLQLKEARPSVLEPFLSAKRSASESVPQGQRIVEGQRLMQAVSDAFLGWTQDDDGRDCFVRQFRDRRKAIDTRQLSPRRLTDYARLCAWALARAHAKSGLAAALTGYLGKGPVFDHALTEFALSYADLVERDFAELTPLQPSSTGILFLS